MNEASAMQFAELAGLMRCVRKGVNLGWIELQFGNPAEDSKAQSAKERRSPGRWLSAVLLAFLVQATLLLSARSGIVAGDASPREKLRHIIERRRQRPGQFGSQAVMVETLKGCADQLEQTTAAMGK